MQYRTKFENEIKVANTIFFKYINAHVSQLG